MALASSALPTLAVRPPLTPAPPPVRGELPALPALVGLALVGSDPAGGGWSSRADSVGFVLAVVGVVNRSETALRGGEAESGLEAAAGLIGRLVDDDDEECGSGGGGGGAPLCWWLWL